MKKMILIIVLVLVLAVVLILELIFALIMNNTKCYASSSYRDSSFLTNVDVVHLDQENEQRCLKTYQLYTEQAIYVERPCTFVLSD